MRIVLIIVAVTGILLLAVLLLAALCLFYPVSYRIKGEIEDEVSLYGRFWWLFGLLRFEFSVRDFEPRMQFGIFWIKYTFGDVKSEEKADAGPKPAPEKASAAKTGEADANASLAEVHHAKEDGNQKEDKSRDKRGSLHAKPNRRRFHRKRADAHGRRRTGRLGRWKARYRHFRTEVFGEGNRMAIKHLWQEATYIFTHLKPKYAQGAVYFATGDPALTGQATGALSLMPVIYQYDVSVCPDFVSEEFYVRGQIALRGRMSLYHAALSLIRIIRDENAMKLIQKYR